MKKVTSCRACGAEAALDKWGLCPDCQNRRLYNPKAVAPYTPLPNWWRSYRLMRSQRRLVKPDPLPEDV